jgi:rhamnose utilization protein RhaD (predicted bifunctional aldolase and dehydrogenase)
MNELALTKEFIDLSRCAGMRFDLVQAGGGNSSVKLDDQRMLVKASGVQLSDIEEGKGYVEVDYPLIAQIIDSVDEWLVADQSVRDADVVRRVAAATKPSSGARASIEVFMHAVLGRFVLHTHPIAVNLITCRKDWNRILDELFPGALGVPYFSPGIELGAVLSKSLKDFRSKNGLLPKLIFLQNHGLLIHSDAPKEVQELTEDVVLKCEDFFGVDLRRYRTASALASYIGDGSIAFLSEDRELIALHQSSRELEAQRPLYPDSLVFCGVEPLVLQDLNSRNALEAYQKKYYSSPKIVLLDGGLYFMAKNVRKAKEIEEVYKAHAMVLTSLRQEANHLSQAELAYLGNWDAEKYRRDR